MRVICSALVTFLLTASALLGAPAPRLVRSLEKELPGDWRMVWGQCEYDATFGADGGYAYRQRWKNWLEGAAEAWWWHVDDWRGDNGWHPEHDGTLWVRERDAHYHWSLKPTPDGWAGTCWRVGHPEAPLRVELHRYD